MAGALGAVVLLVLAWFLVPAGGYRLISPGDLAEMTAAQRRAA